MTMLYLILSILFALMFFYFFNPLSLGLTLICQTISLSLFLGSMTNSFWFLYLLMLIFIGGMLVLFIYVTSIFPNEKFNFNQNSFLMLMVMLISLSLNIFLYKYFFQMNLSANDLSLNLKTSENISLMPSLKMFSSQTNLILIFMVNYLFYCMIVVIKITNFFSGPLRKMT